MGMYSWVEEQDISFRSDNHREMLKKDLVIGCNVCKDRLKCLTNNEVCHKELFCHKELCKSYLMWGKSCSDREPMSNAEIELDFNDRKIISYWYEHTVIFLDFISHYIKGFVWLMFETEEEKAKIEFKNGKFFIHIYIFEGLMKPITKRWKKMGTFDRESIRE